MNREQSNIEYRMQNVEGKKFNIENSLFNILQFKRTF